MTLTSDVAINPSAPENPPTPTIKYLVLSNVILLSLPPLKASHGFRTRLPRAEYAPTLAVTNAFVPGVALAQLREALLEPRLFIARNLPAS